MSETDASRDGFGGHPLAHRDGITFGAFAALGLTAEERAQMDPHADKWIEIGLRTGPADRAKFEAAAAECYEYAKLKWPGVVVWVDSPLVGARAAPAAAVLVGRNGKQNVRASVEQAVAMAKSGAVNDDPEIKQAIKEGWNRYIGGQFWVGGWGWWGNAYTSFFRDVCKLELPGDLWDRSRAYDATAESACWWWPYDDYVVVSERPLAIHRELVDPARTRGWGSHRLHNASGPAVVWPDGWGVWSWHGVRVPQRVIEAPDTITVAEALAEPNAEVRRVMLTRIGPERMAREGGMTVVDEVKDDQVEIGTGTDGLPTPVGLRGGKLLRAVAGEQTMQWVSLLNSTPEPDGTIKPYWLRVPPTVTTVREAVAWTFNQRPEEYQPIAES